MRFRYLLYPEAQDKLNSSGLLKKIQDVHDSEEGLPIIGYTSDEDIIWAVKEMQEQGFFKTMPNTERKDFMTKLNEVFKDKKGHTWRVHRNGGVVEEPAEAEDFYLMTGWLSSCVLDVDEIWDYRKFDFQSLNDFVGCVGAAVWLFNHGDFRGGYKWSTTTTNGRTLENNITGDSNLDLRIHQTDITHDRLTFDPVGAVVSYRPELDDDHRCVAAYHSTEQDFIVGVLKWIHQQNIPSEMLKDRGLPLIKYIRSLGHTIGAATECFGDFGGMDNPMIRLNYFYDPMPVLDENYTTEKPTFDGVHVDGESFYSMYVGPSRELILSYQGKEREAQKKIDACFLPSEADHLLRGICYQAAKGLGRTIPQKLISL
ncbi:hypothetical protein HYV88_03105 [Candidatus Woesearchaeota archaeon]|nr:hypothetical protein [Candidatus Woesearchaeota archaeon]